MNDAIHYRTRRREECGANYRNYLRCEGDCVTCRFRKIGLTDHYDTTDQYCDRSSINTPSMLRCQEWLWIMQSLDPDGKQIGQMIMAGYTSKDIAHTLGIAPSTYHYRWNKLRKAILKLLTED